MYFDRDRSINHIKARPGRRAYGMGLGIMLLDDLFPGFPGDVRNASAYPFPIQYEVVTDVDGYKLVVEEDKSPCLPPIIAAAKNLEQMGCRAIAAECGYFAYFQKDVAKAVDVPVFMSSLLQVPFAQQLIGHDKLVGIMCASKNFLGDRHLEQVGVKPGSNYVIAGAMDEYECQQFRNLWHSDYRAEIPEAYYDKAEEEIVAMAVDYVKRYPDIGALVFECTGFQPFARAVQRAVERPVFSWGTLLDYAYSVTVHRDFYGHV